MDRHRRQAPLYPIWRGYAPPLATEPAGEGRRRRTARQSRSQGQAAARHRSGRSPRGVRAVQKQVRPVCARVQTRSAADAGRTDDLRAPARLKPNPLQSRPICMEVAVEGEREAVKARDFDAIVGPWIEPGYRLPGAMLRGPPETPGAVQEAAGKARGLLERLREAPHGRGRVL